ESQGKQGCRSIRLERIACPAQSGTIWFAGNGSIAPPEHYAAARRAQRNPTPKRKCDSATGSLAIVAPHPAPRAPRLRQWIRVKGAAVPVRNAASGWRVI